MNRLELLDKLDMVAPALSTRDTIPVLQCFWFTGTNVLAYNDQIAISTKLKTDFTGAILGKMLLDLLKANQAKELELIPETNRLLIKAGSSRIRIDIMSEDSFRDMFEMPTLPREQSKTTDDNFFEAIQTCLRSVSDDIAMPDQLGITIIPTNDKLTLYSTNNITISKAELKVNDSFKHRTVLSELFCKQMLALRKPSSFLLLSKDHALFSAGDSILFGRLIESSKPVDFAKVIESHVPSDFRKNLIPIPKKLEEILDSAIIVTELATVNRKATLISIKEPGKMVFRSNADHGEVVTALKIDEAQPAGIEVRAEPKHIKTGFNHFSKWLVTKRSIIMTNDGSTIYLIGTVSV